MNAPMITNLDLFAHSPATWEPPWLALMRSDVKKMEVGKMIHQPVEVSILSFICKQTFLGCFTFSFANIFLFISNHLEQAPL